MKSHPQYEVTETSGVSFKKKKSFGQNFLKSKEALLMMCTAGEVGAHDTILEIGPGKGVLTEKLLERGEKVIAIEKDTDLIPFLSEKFNTEIKTGKLILVHDDILSFEPKKHALTENSYKIIANIPYNITGAIIKRFLSETERPERMVLLVQKEVAERIVARDGKESILSLSVKAYGTPTYKMKVGKRFFSPAPKVDSAIIAITGIGMHHFKTKKEEGHFFDVIKAGFSHKRKVLRKNLEEIAPLTCIDSVFKELSLDEKIRAEDVPFTTWILLARAI